MEEAIKKSIEGGYQLFKSFPVELPPLHILGMTDFQTIALLTADKELAIARRNINSVFLDPLFWQALGKAMGWDVLEDGREWESNKFGFIPVWQHYWHRFIDALVAGQTPDEFFKELLENLTKKK